MGTQAVNWPCLSSLWNTNFLTRDMQTDNVKEFYIWALKGSKITLKFVKDTNIFIKEIKKNYDFFRKKREQL